MYTKIQVNGITKTVCFDELEFFSTCPNCGAEVPVPDLFDLLEDKDFDPYTTAICCDRCSDAYIEAKGNIEDAKICLNELENNFHYLHELSGISKHDAVGLHESLEKACSILARCIKGRE